MANDSEIMPAVDLIVRLLYIDREGVEPYAFVPEAYGAVELILDGLFTFPLDPRPTLDRILKLVCALGLELRSPSAAGLLRAVLSADPRVASTLGGAESEAAKTEHTRWGGEPEVKRAPEFGASAPEGTLKLGSMLPRFQARPVRP